MTSSEAELRRKDERGRERAQTVFDRPLVLAAGAGTGKTTELVARILAWCLGPGWGRARSETPDAPPERIARRVCGGVVAITFTEAAAAEMSARVARALHEIEAGDPPLGLRMEHLPADPERRERARALRGALDHLIATTIHAWCRRLLVAHPLDAGLHADLQIDADGSLRQEVVREILDLRLRQGYAGDDPRLLELAALGVGPREIEVEILALLEAGLPARVFRDDPLSPARVGALGARLAEAVAQVAAIGAPLLGAGRVKKSVAAIEEIQALAARLEEQPVATRADLATLRDGFEGRIENASAKLGAWARSAFGKKEGALLGDAASALAEASRDLAACLKHVKGLDLRRLDLGRAVFGDLLGEVEQALRARGVATFHDLIDGASELLAGNARVAASVRARIDQLLVDEFQDTDARQCRLLGAVALSGPPESRPGLFVVGDPKQSIYGWRSADLTAYEGFVAAVEAAGGEREALHVNYRSVGRVLDEVSRVVAPVMQERSGVQPAFEPLVPCDEKRDLPGFSAHGRAPAEYWVSAAWDGDAGAPAPRTPVAEASRLEAAALAADLSALHDAGVPWGAAAVLFRSRTDWDVYLAALRENEIPFAVEGDRSYYRRREIVDAAALVRAALDPNDSVALLTLLRSAAVGVPDAALIPLFARDLPRLFNALQAPDSAAVAAVRSAADAVAARLPADVPGIERIAGWERCLADLAGALGRLRRSAREEPVDVFVEALRTELFLETSEAARYQGAWRAANLDRFFRELLAELADGGDFHRVLRHLRTSLADERDAEEGRPKEILEDAVQIMTIHGAKGLDFDHVYVMQLHKGPPPRRQASVEIRAVSGEIEYRVLGSPTPGWDLAERERSRVEDAERVRTLYVALTRARERVVLSGLWPEYAHGSDGRLVDLVARGLGDAGAHALEAAIRGDSEGVRDETRARWVFPARSGPAAEAVRGRRSEPPGLATPEAITADAERLERARVAMRERMARPLGRAASDEAHESPEVQAERGWSRSAGVRAEGAEAGEAAAVGTAVHRALEGFDFAGDPEAELARALACARAVLKADLPADAAASAAGRADRILEGFARGRLLPRLRALAPHIVARELPVLLAPGESDGAVGFVSGALDLVYTDPESGRLVVADYKTGAPRDYRTQGERYVRALREALGLDYAPRFELWYLDGDAVVAA